MVGYQFSHGFLAILLVSLVWGAVWAPTMALYDGVLVTETKARGFNYGSLRVWSSVAFILGVVICGAAVDRNGPSWVLYVGFAGIVLLVPAALLLPPAESHHRDAAKHAPFGIRDLLTSRPFLLFMVATGLCQASHAVLYSFGTLTWRAAGIDDVTISLLWGLSVAVEIVLMLFSGRLLARLGVCGMIALALGCGMVRWLGMAFTTELWALVPLQALHAGSFAACHLGAMAFIQRALPASGAALGQSVYYAIGTGATQAVIFQIAGVLYGEYGQKAFLGHVRRQRRRHGGDRGAGAPVEGRAARRQRHRLELGGTAPSAEAAFRISIVTIVKIVGIRAHRSSGGRLARPDGQATGRAARGLGRSHLVFGSTMQRAGTPGRNATGNTITMVHYRQ